MSQNHSILSESSRIAAIVPAFWDKLLLKNSIVETSKIVPVVHFNAMKTDGELIFQKL
ncbi:hypothetical protein LBBP_02448 [Leptospira borgpetersenii serovar Ballum]|uniref:Uncharacterized protein n=1 Tax=Leptospira borgpetersenii serovar Ballum TaxID=280505 RepID=A0A0S2ISQ8_LEPBO|nr:hypothetical protein LBBP_02448 [Leptospira borgpetersenii serovar Ballum]